LPVYAFRHRVKAPTDNKGSITLSKRDGDGICRPSKAGYNGIIASTQKVVKKSNLLKKFPPGLRIFFSMVLSVNAHTRLPPAESPTNMIFSPVHPTLIKENKLCTTYLLENIILNILLKDFVSTNNKRKMIRSTPAFELSIQ
jgi:hypothetical protein